MPLVLDWTGLRGVGGRAGRHISLAAADAADADAEAGALPSAVEPAWPEQVWAKLHNKDLADADAFAPGTRQV